MELSVSRPSPDRPTSSASSNGKAGDVGTIPLITYGRNFCSHATTTVLAPAQSISKPTSLMMVYAGSTGIGASSSDYDDDDDENRSIAGVRIKRLPACNKTPGIFGTVVKTSLDEPIDSQATLERPSLLATPSLPTSPHIDRRVVGASDSRPTGHGSKDDSFSCDVYVQLNQYKLTRQIGQGSYGIVKLAYNEEDNNHYAMKILDKRKLTKKFALLRKRPNRNNKSSGTPDPLARVQREIAILKKLSHPNVVKLFEVLEDPNDNYLYMVFEYVECGCVLEIPTSEPLSDELAWSYFRDTVMGLEYYFGVSSEFEGLDAILTSTAGTPAFMAPEALIEDGSHFYSGRAQDLWSLGITLFSFIYGHVPFWDTYVIALYRKIKKDPLIFPLQPIVQQDLMDLLERLLEKNPVHRLSLAAIKTHPWITRRGKKPLPSEKENCQLVTVTDDDIRNSVKTMPRLSRLS